MRVLGRIIGILIFVPNWGLIAVTSFILFIAWIAIICLRGLVKFILFGNSGKEPDLGFDRFLVGWVKVTICNLDIHHYGNGRFSHR